MGSEVKPIPEGHHTVTPYLIIKDAADAITFYKKAFEATVELYMADDDGKVQHAEIEIGNSRIMVVDEFLEHRDMRGPQSLGGTTVHMFIYVEDVDTFFAQAVEAGAKMLMPVENQPEGDRRGGIVDPFGHVWWIATHVEDVPFE